MSITTNDIPPEALEAFLRAVEAHEENISGEAARAACLAMLAAWPNKLTNGPHEGLILQIPAIILPLPPEKGGE